MAWHTPSTPQNSISFHTSLLHNLPFFRPVHILYVFFALKKFQWPLFAHPRLCRFAAVQFESQQRRNQWFGETDFFSFLDLLYCFSPVRVMCPQVAHKKTFNERWIILNCEFMINLVFFSSLAPSLLRPFDTSVMFGVRHCCWQEKIENTVWKTILQICIWMIWLIEFGMMS